MAAFWQPSLYNQVFLENLGLLIYGNAGDMIGTGLIGIPCTCQVGDSVCRARIVLYISGGHTALTTSIRDTGV